MGILANIRDADFTGLNRAFGRGKHTSKIPLPGGAEGVGIAGGPQQQLGGGRISKKGFGRLGGDGPGSILDDEDTGMLQVGVRGSTLFLLLINLIIYIAIASFQKKWGVGPSGLTGLAIFILIEAILHAAVFLSVPQVYERTDKLKGFARAIRLTRVQFVVFGTQTSLMLIMSLITTISAYSGGCKDASQDPHADNKDYIANMGGFCRNKRAAAVFWFFCFMTFGASLALTTRAWYSIRKLGPRHPTFQPPSGHVAEESAFEVEEDPHEEEHGYEAVSSGGQGGASRPSNAGGYYGDRPVFDEDAAPPTGYGPPQRQATSVQYRPPPPQMSAYKDPFDEIRAQIYQSGR